MATPIPSPSGGRGGEQSSTPARRLRGFRRRTVFRLDEQHFGVPYLVPVVAQREIEIAVGGASTNRSIIGPSSALRAWVTGSHPALASRAVSLSQRR